MKITSPIHRDPAQVRITIEQLDNPDAVDMVITCEDPIVVEYGRKLKIVATLGPDHRAAWVSR